MIHCDVSALLQAPPSLQHVAGAVQRLLLRPALTAGVAALFRPVLLPLASALVDSRLSGGGHSGAGGTGAGGALEASHGAVAVALITLTELAPHLSGCAGSRCMHARLLCATTSCAGLQHAAALLQYFYTLASWK